MNKVITTLLTAIIFMSAFAFAITIAFQPLMWLDRLETEAKDLACNRIGLESWERNMGQDYCEDLSYNLHYIKLINEGSTFDFKYRAVKISIGDVTTKHDALTRKHDG